MRVIIYVYIYVIYFLLYIKYIYTEIIWNLYFSWLTIIK
jgi:hypothetical protein